MAEQLVFSAPDTGKIALFCHADGQRLNRIKRLQLPEIDRVKSVHIVEQGGILSQNIRIQLIKMMRHG